MVKTEEDKNPKEEKWGLFNHLWRSRKKIDSINTELPVSPPPTPVSDSFGTVADEEAGDTNDLSDLVQELKELGIDVSNSDWKDNLKKILKNEELVSLLISDRTRLLEGKDELFKKDLETKNQLKNQLIEAKKERDSIIIQRDKRANITPENLQNLQNEKKLAEQELSKLQEKLRKAGRNFTQTYLNNVIDNATANLFTKDQLDDVINNANNAKTLAEKNLAALQTDLNNNYLKKDDIDSIVVIAKDKGLIDPSNYGELVKAKLVKQSFYDVNLKAVNDQRNFTNKIIVTVQTDLTNEKIAHNETKGQLTILQNQLTTRISQLRIANTTIDNAKRKLRVNDLTALPVLPIGTTGLGDLISQFGDLQIQLANAQSVNANLQGQINSLGHQLSVAQQQIDEYNDVLKNHLDIDTSNSNWRKDLEDELDDKNLKNLIDGLKVSTTTIVDLQTKLEEEKKQLKRQKVVNQQLSLENEHSQQEINDREVNLLKYFLEQLNLEVEVINKEQVLAKIWELINSKPGESVVENLKRKIQEQEEIITNYHQGENYVPITAIRDEVTECLKNCGIYSTNISQVTSFKEVSAFQQQAIKQEISKLKSQNNVTKNLNIVLCSLLLGLLIIIINLRMKTSNSKRKVVK